MDFFSSEAALRGAFDGAWPALAAATPGVVGAVRILHDNEDKLKPPPDTENGEAWVRFTVVETRADDTEISSRNSQNTGFVIVSIFTKLGTGDELARRLATHVRDIFQQDVIGGVICRVTHPSPGNATPDNTWFQVNAVTPFEYESTPA